MTHTPGPSCAHLRLDFVPIQNENGTCTERWLCVTCQAPFDIRAVARAQYERDIEVEHRRRAEMQRDKARESYEEIAATCGLHPDTTLDVLLSFIESVRAEARVSADAASAEYHAKRERHEARERCRRLFEALEGRLEDAPEWTPQFARALLDELRPHVAKEGA